MAVFELDHELGVRKASTMRPSVRMGSSLATRISWFDRRRLRLAGSNAIAVSLIDLTWHPIPRLEPRPFEWGRA